jgi:hypothetical protein
VRQLVELLYDPWQPVVAMDSPPTEFQRAVMACPPMCSMEYLKAILENGPRGMMPTRS